MKRITDGNDGARPRRRALIGVTAAVIVMAVIAVLALRHGASAKPAQPSANVNLATVERTSLVSAFVLSGTLGYGDAYSLGGGGGVVTKLPQAGQTIDAGSVIMEIEGAPVFLLQGDLPLWRVIGPGVSGVDVATVRSAIAALGIDAGAPGGQTYDNTLSTAIRALYSRAGYSSVPPTTEQQAARDQAKAALADAQAGLKAAQSALTDAQNRRPSQSAIVAADNAVSQAQRAYQAALSGQCGPSVIDATPAAQCSPDDIQAALDAYNLAVAQRNDLNLTPDTTAEQAGVAAAQRNLDASQKAYNDAFADTVGPQSVILAPEAQIRVDNVVAKIGLPATGTVLTWTQTTLYGRVNLTESQRALVATGTKATMTLPDGTTVDGTVGEITDSRTDAQTMQTTPASARIDITDQTAVAGLGTAAVTVSFIQDEVGDTLVVPVTALMALAEGGYCVERPNGTLVAVKVGLVADTRAQVISDELHEGDQVVIP